MTETLFDMIKFWDQVDISKEIHKTQEEAVEFLKSKIIEEVVYISFSGYNNWLFASTYVLAINSKNEIVDSYCTCNS